MMTWVGRDIRLLAEVEDWILGLDDDTYDQVAAAIDVLADLGPALGRPLVDRIEARGCTTSRSCGRAPAVDVR